MILEQALLQVSRFHEEREQNSHSQGVGKSVCPDNKVLRHMEDSANFYEALIMTANNPEVKTRYLRLCLILEEAQETCKALMLGDEVEILDGLCDLIYVCLGTGVAYNLPVSLAFEEVCRANLDKVGTDARVRDKGPNWKPPQIAAILRSHREKTSNPR